MYRPTPRTALGRAVAIKQPVQIADVQTEPGYFNASPGLSAPQMARFASARTIIAVPMLKDNELIGAIISTARKCGHLPTSRSRWSRTSLRKR